MAGRWTRTDLSRYLLGMDMVRPMYELGTQGVTLSCCRKETMSAKLTSHRVLTRISATVAAPYPERKFDGIFTITTELSPLASPAFEVGR